MKKLFSVFIFAFLLLSCSKENDTLENEIIGEWKLFEVMIIDFQSNPTIDYSDKNIIYTFKSDGTMIVSGGQNPGYSNGEYEYIFEEDFLGELPEGPKTWLVKINSTKWTYELSEGIMTLSNSFVDGPTLRFKRNGTN